MTRSIWRINWICLTHDHHKLYLILLWIHKRCPIWVVCCDDRGRKLATLQQHGTGHGNFIASFNILGFQVWIIYIQFGWTSYLVTVTPLIWNLVNIDSGNGLLPNGTKPLPEPMLTNHGILSIFRIHLRKSSQEMLKVSVHDVSLQITHLRLQPHFLENNPFTSYIEWHIGMNIPHMFNVYLGFHMILSLLRSGEYIAEASTR